MLIPRTWYFPLHIEGGRVHPNNITRKEGERRLASIEDSIGIFSVWYKLRLPSAFSYSALSYLNENLTQNISVRKNKVHLD